MARVSSEHSKEGMAHLTSENSSQGTSTDSSSADLEKRMTDSSSADLEKSMAQITSDNSKEGSASARNRTLKQQVIDLYHKLKQLLTSEDFETNLRNELDKSNPDYITNIDRRMKDMDKDDHGIVIAGETSAGKSTLINKILGKTIFRPRTLESTATICKIRNLEGLKVITESKNGRKTEQKLTDRCNFETKEGLAELKKELVKLTEISSVESKEYRSVDIGFPIPMLKGNTILVDTPGIGPNVEITKKLMEYLPNAVSFIFVITVASAGGMQNDRLPEILRKVRRQMIDEMPCFDPEDAIFITNKWDTIKIEESEIDSGDESDKERTWHDVKSRIHERWPAVKDENIFQLSLCEVSENGKNASSQQFREFRKKLEVNIEKTDNIRVLRHLSFLQGILWTVQGGLNARLKFHELKTGQSDNMLSFHEKLINGLIEENQKAHASLHERITSTIENTVTECYTYMTSEEGKEHILNPSGMVPIVKDSWVPLNFDEKVLDRVNWYYGNFLRSRDVQSKFLNIQEELNSYTRKSCSQLSEFESKWLGLGNSLFKKIFTVRDYSKIKSFVKSVHDNEYTGLELIVGSFLNIGVAATALAFLPISVPIILLLDRESRKKNIIEKEYNKLMSSFRDEIRNHLNSTCGELLKVMVNKVTEEFLPRRIDHLTELVRQLVTFREENRQKRDLFLRLLQQIKAIEESAANIQEDLLKLD